MKKQNRRNIRRLAALAAGILLSITVGSAGPVFAAGTAAVSSDAGLSAIQAEGRWELKDGSWYYYKADGTPGCGWLEYKDNDYYLTENGRMLTNCLTPDGYYVDGSGRWYRRSARILNADFDAPKRFPAVTGGWTDTEALQVLRTNIPLVFSKRQLRITDTSIEYLSGSGNREKLLLCAYKLPDSGAYRLDIGISLNQTASDPNKAETYDYQVFRAMLYQVSSTPELLEAAIYDSWEGENRWQIHRTGQVPVGDSLLKYAGGSGHGYYYIYPGMQN